MEHGQEHITVVDENGDEQLFEVLFTFESEDFGKSYVLYFPAGAEEDDEGEIEIHASSFVENEDSEEAAGGELRPVETDEEWDMIEEMLNTFLEDEENEENEEV